MDNEVSGSGNQYDYGFRIYNPRIGRFLSTDPLFKSFPWYTPYQYAGNKPIACIDLDGLEETGFTRMLDNKFSTPAGAEKFNQENKPFQKPAIVVTTALVIGTVGLIAPEAAPYIWRAGMYLSNPVNQQVAASAGAIAAGFLDPNPIGAPTADLPGPDEVGRVIKASTKKLFGSLKPILERRKELAKAWGIASEYVEFSKQVFTDELKEGTKLVQYRLRKGTVGDYFVLPGTKPEQVGLDPNDVKEILDVTVSKKTKVLISTHKTEATLYYDKSKSVEGGGIQIFSEELKKNSEIKSRSNGTN